jgi:hypothetical protein
MLAQAKIIGYVDLRDADQLIRMRKLLLPPNPGSRVYMPFAKFLEDIFNRGIEGDLYKQPLYLGKAEIIAASEEDTDQRINFYMDGADLTSKHTLISAIDGVGKTCTAAVIIEELANKTILPIIILDPNDEYGTIGTIEPDSTYRFNFQTAIIKATLEDTPDVIMKKINQRQITIVTAENLSLTEKNEYFTAVLKGLAKSRREKTIPPFLLVVEDAENLPPEVFQEIGAAKNDIATILISSHPTLLGGKALSQIQNFIIGKSNDAQDMAFLKNVIGGNDEKLDTLMIGEWIISGLNILRPTKIYVRKRYSKTK